jgi:hypothetical protein
MRVPHIPALVALAALSCAILPGCLQSPEADATASSIERVSEPGGPEAIGEASQPMGHVEQWYGSKDFPFVVQIKDDGRDAGGGWRRSITTLGFAIYHGVEAVLGEATIYDCLLSPDWNESSEPWPPEKTPEERMRDLVAKWAAEAPPRTARARPSGAVFRIIRPSTREPRDDDPDREAAGEPRDDSRPDEPVDTKRRPPGGR